MPNGSRRWFSLSLVLIVAVVVSACGGGGASQPAPTSSDTKASGSAPAQAATPKTGGTLRIIEPADATNLDMTRIVDNYTFIIGEQMYEGLFRMTPDGLVPWLATSTEVSGDGKTWTFKLRSGVKFHDGTPFNAAAVKYNYERVRDGQGFPYTNLMQPIQEIKVVDDLTVQLILKAPNGPLRSILGFTVFGMQSPTAIQKHGENYGLNPAGTGPYKLESWQKGKSVVLVRNPDYWGEKPYLDKLVFTSLPDPAARVAALEAGDADLILEVPPTDVARLSKEGQVQVIAGQTSRNMNLYMNTLKPPFDKPQVRQAVAYATNRDSYIKDILQGQARSARNLIGPGIVGYKDMPAIPYDVNKAKALLAEAGLPNGFSTTMHCSPADELICQAAVQDLQKVGIQAKLVTMEWGTFLQFLFKPADQSEYNMAIVSRISQYVDADFPIFTDFHSANWRPKGTNWTFYKNAEVDKLLDATRSEVDPAKRQAQWDAVFEHLWRDQPWVSLYNQVFLVGANKSVKGVVTTANERIILTKAWLDK